MDTLPPIWNYRTSAEARWPLSSHSVYFAACMSVWQQVWFRKTCPWDIPWLGSCAYNIAHHCSKQCTISGATGLQQTPSLFQTDKALCLGPGAYNRPHHCSKQCTMSGPRGLQQTPSLFQTMHYVWAQGPTTDPITVPNSALCLGQCAYNRLHHYSKQTKHYAWDHRPTTDPITVPSRQSTMPGTIGLQQTPSLFQTMHYVWAHGPTTNPITVPNNALCLGQCAYNRPHHCSKQCTMSETMCLQQTPSLFQTMHYVWAHRPTTDPITVPNNALCLGPGAYNRPHHCSKQCTMSGTMCLQQTPSLFQTDKALCLGP